jgi:hypothetical protein
MDEKELKAQIRKKFKSVERFCIIVRMKYNKFQNMLRDDNDVKRKSNIMELESLYLSTNNETLPNEIDDDLRKLIKTKIYTKYDNVKDFSDSSGISTTIVSNIIRKKSVYFTESTRKICSILNIAYDHETTS